MRYLVVMFLFCYTTVTFGADWTDRVIDVNTNDNTITTVTGATAGTNTPVGAFFWGFGLMFTWCMFALIMRMMRNIAGHRSEP